MAARLRGRSRRSPPLGFNPRVRAPTYVPAPGWRFREANPDPRPWLHVILAPSPDSILRAVPYVLQFVLKEIALGGGDLPYSCCQSGETSPGHIEI